MSDDVWLDEQLCEELLRDCRRYVDVSLVRQDEFGAFERRIHGLFDPSVAPSPTSKVVVQAFGADPVVSTWPSTLQARRTTAIVELILRAFRENKDGDVDDREFLEQVYPIFHDELVGDDAARFWGHADASQNLLLLGILGGWLDPGSGGGDGDALRDLADLPQKMVMAVLMGQLTAADALAMNPDDYDVSESWQRSELTSVLAQPRASAETNAQRDAVVDAMTAGLPPTTAKHDDLKLDPSLFPPDYREAYFLLHEQWRDDPRMWAEHGPDMDWAGEQWNAGRDRLYQLEMDGGGMSEVRAISLLGPYTDAEPGWEGDRYGEWFDELRNDHLIDDDVIHGSTDHARDFEIVGSRIREGVGEASAFYTEIGVDGTVDLSTILMLSGAEDSVEDYGLGLANATLEEPDDGLGFSGADLFDPDSVPEIGEVVSYYSPALLFQGGDFDPTFLAQAVHGVTKLYGQEDHPPIGVELIGTKEEGALPFPVVEPDRYFLDAEGEDPRNIIVSTAALDVEAIEAYLASYDPVYLLSPETPFQDRSEQAGDSPIHPSLASPTPITLFLGAAGQSAEASKAFIDFAAADDFAGYSDPGVAGGMDTLLAANIAVIYHDDQRRVLGLDAPATSITEEAWEQALAMLSDHGRGDEVASTANRLFTQAVINRVEGRLDFETGDDVGTTYRLLAEEVGRLDAIAEDSLFDYLATLDDDARRHNRKVDLAIDALSAGVGAFPFGDASAAAIKFGGPAANEVLSSSWSREHLKTRDILYDADDNELVEHRARLAADRSSLESTMEELAAATYLEVVLESGAEFPIFTDGQVVVVTASRLGPPSAFQRLVLEDSATGETVLVPHDLSFLRIADKEVDLTEQQEELEEFDGLVSEFETIQQGYDDGYNGVDRDADE